jgi:hypothetical protein
MTSTVFTTGTTIAKEWLNDVNNYVYSGAVPGVGPDASTVTYTPGGTGSVPTTVQTKLRESVSVKDFGAVGDGVTDDTAAIQAAADYCHTYGKKLIILAPSNFYKISSTITFNCIDIAVEMSNGPIGVSLGAVGVAVFKATSEFTAFKIYGSKNTVENISIEFVLGSAASSAIGFEFGSSTDSSKNVRLSKFRNLYVRNAYDGFKTVNTAGTVAVAVFELCTSSLHTHIGFNFDAAPGSTNFTFINCFSQGASTGTPQGYVFGSIKDIHMIGCSADSIVDVGVKVTNGDSFYADVLAFESPKLSTATSSLVTFTNISSQVDKISLQGLVVNVGVGNVCSVIGGPVSPYNTVIGAISQQATTITTGTLYKHKTGVPSNGAYKINDSNCAYSDINYGGFDALVMLNGRQSIPSFAFILGSWIQGDFLWSRAPVEAGAASSKYVIVGWSRITTGSGNVLNTDWVQSRVLTGN